MEVEVEDLIARIRVALALAIRLVSSVSIVSGASSSTSLYIYAASESLTSLLSILIEAVRANVELFT